MNKTEIQERSHAYVQQAIAGDQNAFTELYKLHAKAVVGFLARKHFNGDIAKAEDLAQEAFMAASTGIKKFRQESNFFSWIAAIASHKHYKNYQSGRERIFNNAVAFSASDEDLSPYTEDPDKIETMLDPMADYRTPENPMSVLERKQDIANRWKSIATVLRNGNLSSQGLRYIIERCENDCLARDEIAAREKVPESTIKKRVFLGRKALLAEFESSALCQMPAPPINADECSADPKVGKMSSLIEISASPALIQSRSVAHDVARNKLSASDLRIFENVHIYQDYLLDEIAVLEGIILDSAKQRLCIASQYVLERMSPDMVTAEFALAIDNNIKSSCRLAENRLYLKLMFANVADYVASTKTFPTVFSSGPHGEIGYWTGFQRALDKPMEEAILNHFEEITQQFKRTRGRYANVNDGFIVGQRNLSWANLRAALIDRGYGRLADEITNASPASDTDRHPPCGPLPA